MKIKALIMSLFLMLSVIATSAMAKEIELALYYKPGGGSDRHSSIVAKSLENTRCNSKEKVFLNLC